MASERSALLEEISNLEAQIATLSNPATSSKQQQQARPAKRQRLSPALGDDFDIAETLRVLLAANDSALLAAHPPMAKVFEEDDISGVELERAYELVQANAALTGVEFSSTDTRLLSVGATHQTRQHTLAGTLPTQHVPIGFRVRLTVREPTLVDAPLPGAVDSGSDYEVVSMEVEVWGGGSELQIAIDALHFQADPNPPALFALLRHYSLLASQRARLFAGLRTRFRSLLLESSSSSSSQSHKKGKGTTKEVQGETDGARQTNASFLFFSTSRLSLRLSYDISPSPSQLLAPNVSLAPVIPSSLRSSVPLPSLSFLEEIPARFEAMLGEGLEAENVVAMIVQAVFGEVSA